MTDLPPGWEWTTLGEIADISGGVQKQPKRAPVANRYPFLRVANVLRGELDLTDVHEIELFDGELERLALRPGDMLVVEGNGSPDQIGRSALWRGEIESCVHQNHLIRVRPLGVEPAFLDLAWNSREVRNQLFLVAASTSGLYTLSLSKLSRISVPVPPLLEQRRILSRVDELISDVEEGDLLLKQAMNRCEPMKKLFIHRVLYGGHIDPGRFAPIGLDAHVQDEASSELADFGEWRRLGEIADVVGGVTKDSSKQSDPAIPRVAYLRVANVQRGNLDLREVAEIRATPRQVEKLRLQPGDVLLNEGGDRDKLGRGWVWEGQIDDCIHQNHVFRARVRDEIIDPKLLAWHANNSGHWFERNGKQSVNLASISLTTIKQLPVPIPPRETQAQIVATIEDSLDVGRRLEEAIRVATERSTRLRAAIVTQALAGELTEQDPDDEPASVLLERIRAERAAAQPVKRGRRPKSATS